MAAPDNTTAAGKHGLDSIQAQHRRLIAYLRKHGRTSCAELAVACDVACVTARLSELVRLGRQIERTHALAPTGRGTLRRVTFYSLPSEPLRIALARLLHRLARVLRRG